MVGHPAAGGRQGRQRDLEARRHLRGPHQGSGCRRLELRLRNPDHQLHLHRSQARHRVRAAGPHQERRRRGRARILQHPYRPPRGTPAMWSPSRCTDRPSPDPPGALHLRRQATPPPSSFAAATSASNRTHRAKPAVFLSGRSRSTPPPGLTTPRQAPRSADRR